MFSFRILCKVCLLSSYFKCIIISINAVRVEYFTLISLIRYDFAMRRFLHTLFSVHIWFIHRLKCIIHIVLVVYDVSYNKWSVWKRFSVFECAINHPQLANGVGCVRRFILCVMVISTVFSLTCRRIKFFLVFASNCV